MLLLSTKAMRSYSVPKHCSLPPPKKKVNFGHFGSNLHNWIWIIRLARCRIVLEKNCIRVTLSSNPLFLSNFIGFYQAANGRTRRIETVRDIWRLWQRLQKEWCLSPSRKHLTAFSVGCSLWYAPVRLCFKSLAIGKMSSILCST